MSKIQIFSDIFLSTKSEKVLCKNLLFFFFIFFFFFHAVKFQLFRFSNIDKHEQTFEHVVNASSYKQSLPSGGETNTEKIQRNGEHVHMYLSRGGKTSQKILGRPQQKKRK